MDLCRRLERTGIAPKKSTPRIYPETIRSRTVSEFDHFYKIVWCQGRNLRIWRWPRLKRYLAVLKPMTIARFKCWWSRTKTTFRMQRRAWFSICKWQTAPRALKVSIRSLRACQALSHRPIRITIKEPCQVSPLATQAWPCLPRQRHITIENFHSSSLRKPV